MALLLALLGSFLTVACGGGPEAPRKAPGSALAIPPSALAEFGAEARETLLASGVGEVFIDAGRLAESGDLENRLPDAQAERRMRLPVTLVISAPEGFSWPASEEAAATSAQALVRDLTALRDAAESRGLTVVGFHLDLFWPTDDAGLEAAGETLAEVREALAGIATTPLYLSVSATPADLSRTAFAAIAEAVDFLVPHLYGARLDPGRPGPAPPRQWDMATVEVGLEQLGTFGRPYLLGLGTAGLLQRLNGDGEVLATTAQASLGGLVANSALRLGFGGLDTALRQRRVFEAQRATQVGEWRLRPGDRVQVVRPAPSHLRTLAERAAERTPNLHLGQLYDRWPRPTENLSLHLAALTAAARPEDPVPDLKLEVVPQRGRTQVRIRFTNGGPLATDVAYLESNFVWVRALDGGTIAAADAGDFQRYQLESAGARVESMRDLRRADTVRLYLPLAEVGDEVESGVLRLRGGPAGGPVVEVGGRFTFPGGGEVELPMTRWPASPDREP